MNTILALALSLALATGPAPAMMDVSAVPQGVRQAAFDVACSYTPGCSAATPLPSVAYAPTLDVDGAWGEYQASTPDTVWLAYQLAPKLVDTQRIDLMAFVILVHETVHYLDHVVSGSPVNDWPSVCASEAKAWYVQNDFLTRSGAPELVVKDWLEGYPLCRGLVEPAQ